MAEKDKETARKFEQLIDDYNELIPPSINDLLFLIDQAQEVIEHIDHLLEIGYPEQATDTRIYAKIDDDPRIFRFSGIERLSDYIINKEYLDGNETNPQP